MTNNKVSSYAERIERMLDEIEERKADIKDIYTEVKSADLKPKVLRKAIANKRRKVDAQFEADVEEYAALLLALPGATYRSVAEQTGVPKSTLQRRVPRKRNGTEPSHDPETGEIGEVTSIGADAGRPSEPSVPAEQSVNSVSPRERVSLSSNDGEGEHSGTNSDDVAIPDFLRRALT